MTPHVHGLPPAEAAVLTRRITLLSTATAAVLIAVKLVAYIMSGSMAVMASLADSGLDLLASLITAYAVRYAAKAPDAGHRFGHGKAEAFASLLQGGLVFSSAALVGREAIDRLLHPYLIRAEAWSMGAMAVSIVLTLGLILAQARVLKATSSVAVSGDRAHYAADLASNAMALIGIALAAIFDEPRVDAAAGLLVTGWLVWGAVGVFRQAADQLMDRELPEEARARIAALVTVDPRLTDVHQLRTRASGPYIHIQLHADMDPDLTLDEAHVAVVEAEKRILAAFPAADIIIHLDPRGRAEPHGGAFAEMGAESLTEEMR
ncbi:cation diffusion facilitator family transporter [Caulobacter ginsengisoli]|uniref:Cation diffusion facilitator family transporter n=1 Tax=Caulobacter ginsengisoli TaxID=400775 RepID=A0ABU0ITW0_9CAUL|nr:cation diffusion facilitator family transporter [Caulobacter ginsengisoli]MDQ0465446.1 cation diffusion facilitator family transporter [Caulobacter ginsengisoli]